MNQYLTFHGVVDLLQEFQTQSPILNSFGFGNLIDFSRTISASTVNYPYMFVVPLSINYDENITEYQFSIIFADILNYDLSNEKECVSDMSLQAKRFMSYIKRGIQTFPQLYDNLDIVLPAGAIPFMERFGDHTAGVALDCTIQVFETLNACDFYPSPTPTPSVTATLTPTPTELPPCPDRIVISDSSDESFIPNGNWDLLTLPTGSSLTQYGYLLTSPTSVNLGPAPDLVQYSTYGFVSGTTYFQFIWNYTGGSWAVMKSNYDYITNGGTYIGGTTQGNPDVGIIGGIGFPKKGNFGGGFFTEYTISYPSDCPAPTQTLTPTPTPTLGPDYLLQENLDDLLQEDLSNIIIT